MNEKLNNLKHNWKTVADARTSCELIDYGVIVRWQDMRRLAKLFSAEDHKFILRHFAKRLAERAGIRLQAEILVESIMVWLANTEDETILASFLVELFAQPGCEDACRTLVELALTAEVTEHGHDDDVFSMSVALICELGLGIQQFDRQFPGHLRGTQSILDHIATYLLSVSNSNNSCIRLSLLHYFGAMEHGSVVKNYFNRVMSRFGHTVLDHLFNLLFHKRTEAIALQYLLENLPFVLEADTHTQRIVHETFKFYMLKQTDRFTLFVHSMVDYLNQQVDSSYNNARMVFAQHLAALFRITAEVNHKDLGREMVLALARFAHEDHCRKLLNELSTESSIRLSFREFVLQVQPVIEGVKSIEYLQQFRTTKRDRRPSFARAEDLGTLHQVSYLGSVQVPKAG